VAKGCLSNQFEKQPLLSSHKHFTASHVSALSHVPQLDQNGLTMQFFPVQVQLPVELQVLPDEARMHELLVGGKQPLASSHVHRFKFSHFD
jgi:hypothetical protein